MKYSSMLMVSKSTVMGLLCGYLVKLPAFLNFSKGINLMGGRCSFLSDRNKLIAPPIKTVVYCFHFMHFLKTDKKFVLEK